MTNADDISSSGLSISEQLRGVEVTELIREVRAGMRSGDDDDVALVFRVWQMLLTKFARIFIAKHKQRVIDPEHVSAETLEQFFLELQRGLVDEAGQPRPIQSRSDLWRMLIHRLKNLTLKRIRYEEAEKRGGGRITGESGLMEPGKGFDPGAINQVEDWRRAENNSEEDEEIKEQREFLMAVIRQQNDPPLLVIAQGLLDLLSVDELRVSSGLSRSSVHRKINRIREIWQRHV